MENQAGIADINELEATSRILKEDRKVKSMSDKALVLNTRQYLLSKEI